mgnify:CR=1 FL=1
MHVYVYVCVLLTFSLIHALFVVAENSSSSGSCGVQDMGSPLLCAEDVKFLDESLQWCGEAAENFMSSVGRQELDSDLFMQLMRGRVPMNALDLELLTHFLVVLEVCVHHFLPSVLWRCYLLCKLFSACC